MQKKETAAVEKVVIPPHLRDLQVQWEIPLLDFSPERLFHGPFTHRFCYRAEIAIHCNCSLWGFLIAVSFVSPKHPKMLKRQPVRPPEPNHRTSREPSLRSLLLNPNSRRSHQGRLLPDLGS